VLLKPTKLNPVRELVEQAGIDVSHWAKNKKGLELENPNNNIGKNTKWSFGGNGEPIALFIWHDGIDWSGDHPIQVGNTKQQQDMWNAMADHSVDASVKQRLRNKINQTRDFQNALYTAKSKRLPVHVVLLDGIKTEIDAAGEQSSKVKARELDAVSWYVHECNPVTGGYRMVRGVEAPPITTPDPFANLVDPGLDPAFQAFVEDLSETEREAMIKARVGQGAFRDALIKRWGGCSVTGCGVHELLIASHIMPWSRCTTPAERLGAANGLLLTPNLDRLFDRGLITFDDKFKIRLSPTLKDGNAGHFGVHAHLRLSHRAEKDMLPFLEYHGREVFKAASC
jgi:hypothetical protein